MKRQKLAVAVFVVLFTGLSASASLDVNTERDYFAEGHEIYFNFTGSPGNYSLMLDRQGNEVEAMDFEVEGQGNLTYSRELNYTFADGTVNDDVSAFVNNTSAKTQEFFLGTGEPLIDGVDVSPENPRFNDLVTIEATVLDPEMDVSNVSFITQEYNRTVDEEMFELVQNPPYYTFTRGYRPDYLSGSDEYQQSYRIKAEDNSKETNYSSSFEVYPKDYAIDESDITAEISGICGVETDPFRPPGGGTLSVNGSSPFLVGFEDKNYPVNLSYSLNVSYEGNYSQLQDDERVEWMNMSSFDEDYETKETESPITQTTNNTVYTYNRTSRFGWYRGHLDVNGTCYTKRVEDSYYEGNPNITREEFPQWVEEDVTPDNDSEFSTSFTADFQVFRPGGGAGEGDPTDNATVPKEADDPEEEGERMDEDNQEPGQTPVPEPEPVPEPDPQPDPEPAPSLSVNIRDTEDLYELYRGSYSPVDLTITNLAETNFTELSLQPLIEQMGNGWQSRDASIENLGQEESVNRTVFIRPSADEETGRYSMPVLAEDTANDRDLDLQYVDLNVKKANFSTKVEIAEIPSTVQLTAGSQNTIPVLLNNTGRKNISNLNLRVQNLEQCGEASTSDTGLEVNSTSSLDLRINASNNLETCNTTVIVSTSEGAYTFSDLSVTVEPRPGTIPPEFRVPVIAILWTLGLVSYAVARRKLELDSMLVKGPFVIMVMGEVLIILYLAVQYYDIIPDGILPF